MPKVGFVNDRDYFYTKHFICFSKWKQGVSESQGNATQIFLKLKKKDNKIVF